MRHCSILLTLPVVASCRCRGYGRSAAKALEAIRDGEDPAATGTMFQPGGSLGNGGAMRIAPLGLAYRWDSSQRSHAVVCNRVH